MPDLFHFNQTLARRAGAPICKAYNAALQKYKEVKATFPAWRLSKIRPCEDMYLLRDLHKNAYRRAMDTIHKAIHAFDKDGHFSDLKKVNCDIRHSIRQIDLTLVKSKCANRVEDVWTGSFVEDKLNDGLSTKESLKLHDQIPDIIDGVKQWQQWTAERTDNFTTYCYTSGQFLAKVVPKHQLRAYLLHFLIPMIYWQVIFHRIPAKEKNKSLRQYYQQQIEDSAKKYREHPLTQKLTSQQQQACYGWAKQVARSFQRSSSQVEGRNGYLAFIHKANRGLSEQRLKVLTVVHNFDIKSYDGTTPAQRLFGQQFPDLFEFVLDNVTGFVEPRETRPKQLKVSCVRD